MIYGQLSNLRWGYIVNKSLWGHIYREGLNNFHQDTNRLYHISLK